MLKRSVIRGKNSVYDPVSAFLYHKKENINIFKCNIEGSDKAEKTHANYITSQSTICFATAQKMSKHSAI